MGNPPASASDPVVLVVEDDTIVRMMAVATLADAGFTVLEAEHADSALAVLRARATDIHALFTDVRMPGNMDGIMLAHETKRCWPWIGLLITSGYTPYGRAAMPSGSRFLQKPYEPGQVAQHVRELLAA
jgi:two-component system, response regulator PdtaR